MEIITPIIFLLVIVLALTAILLLAKTFLVASGKVKITINGDKVIEVDGGSTLLTTLGNEGIFLPSACGGGGTCVQCTCQVMSGGGSILPTEEPHFSRKQIADNFRLGCQVKVKEDMEIEVEEEVMGIKEWEATWLYKHNIKAHYFFRYLSTNLRASLQYLSSPSRVHLPWNLRVARLIYMFSHALILYLKDSFLWILYSTLFYQFQ